MDFLSVTYPARRFFLAPTQPQDLLVRFQLSFVKSNQILPSWGVINPQRFENLLEWFIIQKGAGINQCHGAPGYFVCSIASNCTH